MRSVPKEECDVLPLVLKGKWYDLIASGEKLEEYRELKPFWEKRITKWESNHIGPFAISSKYLVIGFSRGYRKPDMFFMLRYLQKRERSYHPAWGEPESPHYALGLGNRIELTKGKKEEPC